MKSSPFHGFLVIDKPTGITSRDAVDCVQDWFPRGTKLGHTGTLDPLATGVLAVAVGTGSRLTEYVQHMDKTYLAGLVLGARSDTDDADGTLTPVAVAAPPERADIERCLADFIGTIEQVPPAYSAAKVTGHRAYELARRGKEVQLAARPVSIYGIDLLSYDYPRLDLEVRCGKGTYIRSLARDLGDRLGCGAYIARLRRTRVGPFEAAAGLPPDADAETARARLLPLSAGVTDLPRVTLPEGELWRMRHGQGVPCPPSFTGEPAEVAVFDEAGSLIAVAALVRGRLNPTKIVKGRIGAD